MSSIVYLSKNQGNIPSITLPRQISYDIIRFVAILMVFSIHCMGGLDAQRDSGINIFASNLLHSFQDMGVPLFVLLSGSLLLDRQVSLGNFLMKRMARVLIPFLVWSILLFGIYYITEPMHYGVDLKITPPHTIVVRFFSILFCNGVHGVYWYVYMILGLYLVAPIFQRFLQCADENVISYACILITAVVIMDKLLPDFLVTKRMVSDNITFLGYFLSGYYIKQYFPQKSWLKPMFIASAIFLLVLSFCNQYYLFMNQDLLIYFMSIAFFGVLIKVEVKDGPVRKYITFVSRTSYGMYLSHVLLISLFVKIGIERQMPIAIVPAVMVILILMIESVMMWMIDKSGLSKYLGG